jgi:hypothetical protein
MSEQLPPPAGQPVELATPSKRTPRIILWAFIASFFGILIIPAIAAVVMVAVGWKQIKATGKGKGLAIAAIAISALWIIFVGISAVNAPEETTQPATSEAAEEAVEEEASAEITNDNSVVTRAQFGDDWPFTVDEGTIRCETIQTQGIDDQQAAIINLDGNDYALNGVAINQGFTELTLESDIWLDSDFGLKVPLTPITKEALALCDGNAAEQPTNNAQQDNSATDISALFGTLGVTINDLPKRWNNAVQKQGLGILLPQTITAQNTRNNVAEAQITQGPNTIFITWNPDNNEVSGVEIDGPNNPAENATALAATAVAMVHATTKLTVAQSENLIINDLVGDALDNPDISAGLIIENYEEDDREYRFTLTGVNVTFSVDASPL